MSIFTLGKMLPSTSFVKTFKDISGLIKVKLNIFDDANFSVLFGLPNSPEEGVAVSVSSSFFI